MNLLTVILTIFAVASANEIPRNGRVIGGEVAKPGQFPFMVALISRGHDFPTRHFNGFLITTRTVLTISFILELSATIQVILGAHDTTTVEPDQVRFNLGQSAFHRHPDHVRGLGVNNIGTIILPSAVTLNKFIQTILLATNPDELFTGFAVTTAGWGGVAANDANSAVLRFASSSVISNEQCQLPGLEHLITPTNICWSMRLMRGPCAMDQGGPMFIMRNGSPLVVGVMSLLLGRDCTASEPAVFTRTSHFADFIAANSV